ncbi:MAG: peptidoglycan-binding protein [Patescibacteria group bacterium]
MKYPNKKFILIIDLLLLMAATLLTSPFSAAGHDSAFADELSDIANLYTRTFTISAYYSPLPCQNRYVTGSYGGDIRLNGGGKRGADGTSVYPGMVAAPRSYNFGTKMDIPGVGIVAVHDRGGAIVASNNSNYYDRLDIWMGYGDKGLARALNWGKRTMEVVVYGVNDSIQEQVALGDFSPEEANPNTCTYVANAVVNTPSEPIVTLASVTPVPPSAPTEIFLDTDLKLGDSGDKVAALQTQLKKLNLYRTEVTGNYGEVTKHAVFKFQQIQGLVMDEKSPYSGVFGPKTRDGLNELVASRNYNNIKIAKATDDYKTVMLAKAEMDRPKKRLLTAELRYGTRGPEVAELQKFLKSQGFFEGALITQYYGVVTKEAVLKFQKAHNIINSETDTGAGHVGPATLETINTLS